MAEKMERGSNVRGSIVTLGVIGDDRVSGVEQWSGRGVGGVLINFTLQFLIQH